MNELVLHPNEKLSKDINELASRLNITPSELLIRSFSCYRILKELQLDECKIFIQSKDKSDYKEFLPF